MKRSLWGVVAFGLVAAGVLANSVLTGNQAIVVSSTANSRTVVYNLNTAAVESNINSGNVYTVNFFMGTNDHKLILVYDFPEGAWDEATIVRNLAL